MVTIYKNGEKSTICKTDILRDLELKYKYLIAKLISFNIESYEFIEEVIKIPIKYLEIIDLQYNTPENRSIRDDCYLIYINYEYELDFYDFFEKLALDLKTIQRENPDLNFTGLITV